MNEFEYIIGCVILLLLIIIILLCNKSSINNSKFISGIIRNNKCNCGNNCSIHCDTGEHYGSKDLMYIEFYCENQNCNTHNLKSWFYCKNTDPLFKELIELKTEKNTRRFTIDRLWVIELPIIKEKKCRT